MIRAEYLRSAAPTAHPLARPNRLPSWVIQHCVRHGEALLTSCLRCNSRACIRSSESPFDEALYPNFVRAVDDNNVVVSGRKPQFYEQGNIVNDYLTWCGQLVPFMSEARDPGMSDRIQLRTLIRIRKDDSCELLPIPATRRHSESERRNGRPTPLTHRNQERQLPSRLRQHQLRTRHDLQTNEQQLTCRNQSTRQANPQIRHCCAYAGGRAVELAVAASELVAKCLQRLIGVASQRTLGFIAGFTW